MIRNGRVWYVALAAVVALAITAQLSGSSGTVRAESGLRLEDSNGQVTSVPLQEDDSVTLDGSFFVFSGMIFVVLLAPLGFLALSSSRDHRFEPRTGRGPFLRV